MIWNEVISRFHKKMLRPYSVKMVFFNDYYNALTFITNYTNENRSMSL